MTGTIAPSSSSSLAQIHPFANSTKLLEVLPNNIDVEEESRLYDEITYDDANDARSIDALSLSFQGSSSVFSQDIWLNDKSGESLAFTQDVEISGWTNVGDQPEGAYIVYDCTIRTKEGTVMHAHKRYSEFAKLEVTLRRTLPRNQRHFVPTLPPKSPLARYRPAFLDHRRRLLQSWLTAVLLHPDVGGSQSVKRWVMG